MGRSASQVLTTGLVVLVVSLNVALAGLFLVVSPAILSPTAKVLLHLVANALLLNRRIPRLFVELLLKQWQRIQQESNEGERPALDYRPLVVMVTAAVAITLMMYIGERKFFFKHWGNALAGHDYQQLIGYSYWAACRVVCYVVIPCVVMFCMPGVRIRDCGLSAPGARSHVWIYLVLFAAILPAVVAVSQSPAFQHKYPFYREATRSAFDFAAWEVLYAVQFVSLEFFFRGFMLQAARRSLGVYGIFVMVVPYCMIHYYKPLPEVFGSIFAGIILGTIAMRTNSIWWGVLIHVSVALSMDMLALGHTRGWIPVVI